MRLIEIEGANNNVIELFKNLTEYAVSGLNIIEEISDQSSPVGIIKKKINTIMEQALHEAKSAGVDRPEMKVFLNIITLKIKDDKDLSEAKGINTDLIEGEVKKFYINNNLEG